MKRIEVERLAGSPACCGDLNPNEIQLLARFAMEAMRCLKSERAYLRDAGMQPMNVTDNLLAEWEKPE